MISRRGVLTATLAAIPVGVAGGLLGRSWLAADASIHFLGQDRAMIALLDTSETRALFLLGEPDGLMLAHLPQLMTFGRTRIDLLVGSHRWLTTGGLRSEIDLYRVTTISLQANASLPPIRGNVIPVTDQQLLELGDGCEVSTTLVEASSRASTDPGVRIGVRCKGARIMLASDAAALSDEGPFALVAVPGDVDNGVLNRVRPSLFVGTELPDEYDGHAMLAHYNDPLKLNIKNESVTT